jgi:PAS domain S-box-containing protein/putative nucleotidyltransferase with HDIG domain
MSSNDGQMLSLLFLEDNPADVELAEYELRRAGVAFTSQRVETMDAFRAALGGKIDIILADYTLPQLTALDALEIMKQEGINLPFIVVTGTISEEVAVECIKLGASDYLLKDRLARLPTAIVNALYERSLWQEKQRAEDELRLSEQRYRTLVEVSPDTIAMHEQGVLMYINPAGVAMMGAKNETELLGRNVLEFVHPDYHDLVIQRMKMLQEGAETLPPAEEKLVRTDGRVIDVEIVGGPMRFEGRLLSQLVVRDISARKRRERELKAIAAMSEALRVSNAVDQIVDVLLEQARYLLSAHATMLFLKDPESGEIVGKAGLGLWENAPDMNIYPGGPTEQVLRSGEPLVINEIDEMNATMRDALRDGNLENIRSLICMPLQDESEFLGVLWLGSDHHFDQDDVGLIGALCKLAGTGFKRAFLKEEIETDFLETVLALANTLDVRDTQTADHSQKMAVWAEKTAEEMGFSKEDRRIVRMAALLHDIGKIGVPDSILRKKGPLSEQERLIMQRHPEIGAEIVAPVSKLAEVAPIIRAHQEKWNGSGYPYGLKAEQIPQLARILSVVDAYAAMTENRVYREAMTHAEAVEELRKCSGVDFDPAAVDALMSVLRQMGKE